MSAATTSFFQKAGYNVQHVRAGIIYGQSAPGTMYSVPA
jgi:hypothetical protein